jgi:uncharacterized membrane-anchored protein
VAVAVPSVITGIARVGLRTKELVQSLAPGQIAVIDHANLDRVAAQELVAASPAAVVNAARSADGSHPNLGPLILTRAGIPLVDADAEVLDRVRDGDPVEIDRGEIRVAGAPVAEGAVLESDELLELLEEGRRSAGHALREFAENTLEHVREEADGFLSLAELPEPRTSLRGRDALIVSRGGDHVRDLHALAGYVERRAPVLVGVDGGADALIDSGLVPDLIVGDMDSASEAALRSGAELIVQGYPGGDAPGAARLLALGLPHVVVAAPGTSQDLALLIAYEHGAELLVSVGTPQSLVEFLGKGRAGMSSTFLARLLVGDALVDASGVGRLLATGSR